MQSLITKNGLKYQYFGKASFQWPLGNLIATKNVEENGWIDVNTKPLQLHENAVVCETGVAMCSLP